MSGMTRVGGTHWSGPLLASESFGSGAFDEFPARSVDRQYFYEFFDDFHGFSTTQWVFSQYTSATNGISTGVASGAGIITCAAVNSQGGQIQASASTGPGEGMALPADGRSIFCEWAVKFSLPQAVDFFIGLGRVDTVPVTAATGALLAVFGDACIGFHHVNGTGTAGVPIARVSGNALATIQNVTATRSVVVGDDEWTLFQMRLDGLDRVRFYINNIPYTAWTTITVPFTGSVGMCPTAFIVGSGAADTLTYDYIQVLQTR